MERSGGRAPAISWLVRRTLRQRAVGLALLALIVGLGVGGSLVALGAATRTDRAYDEYLERADVGDLAINPGLPGTDIDRVIRNLPGVREVTRDNLFVSTDDPAPQTRFEVVEDLNIGSGRLGQLQIRGSADGRYSAMDRPVPVEGRLPTGKDEIVVNRRVAGILDLEIGDRFTIAFWPASTELRAAAEQTETIEPLGVERPRLVGIVTFPDDVLEDDLFPSELMVVSPDIAARYSCLPEPPTGDVGFDEAVQAFFPDDCSVNYPYYSLSFERGEADIPRAIETFIREAAALNETLPPAVAEDGGLYFLAAQRTDEDREQVSRAIAPTVAALGILAAATAAVALFVLGLAVVRELRRHESEHRFWWQLGMTEPERVLTALAPVVVVALAGLAVAVLIAWLLSPVAPVGVVRAIDPSPARELSGPVLLAVLGAVVVLTVGSALVTFRIVRAATRPRPARPSHSYARRLAELSPRPEVGEGIRAATGTSRGPGLVAASGAVAVALFAAATIFSASLTSVLDRPATYGWPWDLGLVGGGGYGGVDLAAATEELDARDDVAAWTGLGFTNSVTVDGTSVVALVDVRGAEHDDVTVVDGRLPRRAGEVALGSRTASELDRGIGDRVRLGGDDVEPGAARVVGVVALPAIGPIEAGRAGPGTGILLPGAALAREPDSFFTFLGIDVAPGADEGTVLREVQEQFPAWDPFGIPAVEAVTAIRPPEIRNVSSIQVVPLVVGALLMATTVIGLVVAVVVSVRARRRDLAVLRSMGFTARQVRDAVRVETVATMAGALVIGVPLGIVIGRVAWRAFATGLGVVPTTSVPILVVAGIVVGALVVALAAAAVPARIAGRARPAEVLRSE